MTTLREAAQQALAALEFVGEDTPHWAAVKAAVKRTQAITALRAALAQQAESVAQEACVYPNCLTTDGCEGPCRRKPPAPQQAEPVAWVDIEEDGTRHGLRSWSEGGSREHALYTTPPQRKPLTDEEIWGLAANCLDSVAGKLNFARAIERAHGIGGNDGQA